MKRSTFHMLALAMLLSLGLSACSSSAPAATTAEATAAPTEAPTAAAAPADTSATTQTAPAASAAVTDSAATADSTAPTASARTFVIDPARSDAGYQVDEEFLGQNLSFVKTVGKTQVISGTLALTIDGSSVTLGDNQFTVDLSTLTSDRPRRDQAIRRDWLESSKYPLAIFKANGVTDLPASAALGQPVTFKLAGDMTIREITNPLTWDVTATLDGSSLSGTATSLLYMRDFGFEPPDIAGMLKVTDGVTVTVNFAADEVQ